MEVSAAALALAEQIANGAFDGAEEPLQQLRAADIRSDERSWLKGMILARKGQLAEALEKFDEARQWAPTNPLLYEHKAAVQRAMGDPKAALQTLGEAYSRGKFNPSLIYTLGEALARGNLRFTSGGNLDHTPETLAAHLFELGTLDAARKLFRLALVNSGHRYTYIPPHGLLALVSGDGESLDDRQALALWHFWELRLEREGVFDTGALDGARRLGRDLALMGLLERVKLCSLRLEREFGRIAMVLAAAGQDPDDADARRFLAALATQNEINEYVAGWLDHFEPPDTAPLLCAIAGHLPAAGEWPAELALLKSRAVEERDALRALMPDVPQLTEIDADTTHVQTMYEENPYPRWREVPPAGEPEAPGPLVRRLFPQLPEGPLDGPEPAILIAGCGTGKQTYLAAKRYAGAAITGIDISRASLSYARMKLDQLGAPAVKLMQADILRLEPRHGTFALIESVGVLHHLKEPARGVKSLAQLLAPGGVMRLAFYSRAARERLNEIRGAVRAGGFSATSEGIRAFRAWVQEDEHDTFYLSGQLDFYTMSDCRDMLFHVEEHQFDIPELLAMMAGAGLEVLGIEPPAHLAGTDYARAAGTDPMAWAKQEAERQEIFAGMIYLWVRRG